jgi:hypothetical protein
VSVVCCEEKDSASDRSLVKRGPIECVCVSECDREISLRGPMPTRNVGQLHKAGIYGMTGIVCYKLTHISQIVSLVKST